MAAVTHIAVVPSTSHPARKTAAVPGATWPDFEYHTTIRWGAWNGPRLRLARAIADKKRPVRSQRGWRNIAAASQEPVQSTADARNNASVRALGTNNACPRVAGNPR